MRSLRHVFTAGLVIAISGGAIAELQNVTVTGNIRIRGNLMDFHDNGGQVSGVEQRTRLGAQADFTNEVRGYIELDSYDIWGEDFRANGLNGIDGRAASGADVEVYQSYIETRKILGTDLSVRVGRQELALGDQWLVGTNDTSSLFTGLSFDALRLDYGNEDYNVTIFGAKLAETLGKAFENDTNLYGVWGNVRGSVISDKLKDINFDAYYLLLNDDGPLAARIGGRMMDLHTAGIHAGGKIDAVDFNVNGAYQFGYVGRNGGRDARSDNWAADAELGYTFDVKTNPRVYAGAAVFTGSNHPRTDLSFNRLFSNVEYSEFLDVQGNLSNVSIYRGGVSIAPREDLTLKLAGSFFLTDMGANAGFPGTAANNNDAVELGLYADYHYSKDLVVRAGYAHLITLKGAREGNRILANGFARLNHRDTDDADYCFLESELSF